jgi:hypothetical protein
VVRIQVTGIINEIASIKDFISEKFPDVGIVLQNVPEQPVPSTLVIRFQRDNREIETGFGVVANREYQLIYFGERAPDVLTKMDGLSRKFLYGRTVIPIKNSPRYIRVVGFNFGQIFKTEQNNIEACIGVLQTEVREARDQQTYDKIMNVYARYE